MRTTPVWIAVYAGLMVGVGYCAWSPERWPLLIPLALLASGVLAYLIAQKRLGLGTVLVVAFGLRALFFAWPPLLSDDAYRYVWDGRLQAEGINPYTVRPSDPALAPYHTDSLYARLNSKEFHTVYPPVSQGLFGIGGLLYDAGWEASYYTIKTLLVALEAGALLILTRLVPPATLALYAWHPLVLIETAGQAHTESALLFFLVTILWATRSNRAGWLGAAGAAAGWTKLYPFVFFPLLAMRGGWRTILAFAAVALGLLAPYWHTAFFANFRSSLDLYVQFFEFNAGLYYGVKQLFLWNTGADWSKQIGPAFRVLFLASLFFLYVWDAFRKPALERSLLAATTLFLVFSTTVHPWYLLPALLLALFDPRTPWHWHWLATFSLGSYFRYIDGPYWLFVNLTWIGALAIAGVVYRDRLGQAGRSLLRFRAEGKARRIVHHLPRRSQPLRVLDLGAAEGYVGQAIQERTGAEVVLSDVIDLNKTPLPHVLYDGRQLPFEDNAFDAVILYFVLHHCQDAEQVLREALRVTRGRVIVVESVYRTDEERRRLDRLDRLANRIRSGGRMRAQEEHLHFRPVTDWKSLLRRLQAPLIAEGGWGNALHRQHLFVVDKQPVPPSAPAGSPRFASASQH